MICPQTKAKCKNLAFCDMTGKCLEHEADLLTPTPPTLAEIERLIKGISTAAIVDLRDSAYWSNLHAAECALMAAIRAYGRE